MKVRLTMGVMAVLLGAILIGQLRAGFDRQNRSLAVNSISHRISAPAKRPPASPLGKKLGLIGPDVIVSRLDSIAKYGTIGSITGYAASTTCCNLGDMEAEWFDTGPNANKHPLIGQNFYRYLNGRMEHIGMGWVKHAFCAFDQNDLTNCAVCQTSGSCDTLGIGCSDTYTTAHNASQTSLGPRSEVNSSTGVYPYPYVLNWNQSGNSIFKRLQIDISDLDPTPNAGARYFLEVNYLTTDEPAWGNQYNNAAYRECFVGTFTTSGYNLTYGAPPTQPQKTAIHAWQDIDPSVTLVEVDVPGDGRFIVGYRITDNGDDTWHYEYGIYNLNSDLSARSVSLAAPSCLSMTNIGFHDVAYHSGEPYSGADWTGVVAGDLLTWSTDTFATDPNANALRWNTLYNFRFDADAPPGLGSLTLGMFKPGPITSVLVPIMLPDPGICAADIAGGDNVINVTDLLLLLAEWGNPDSPADISGSGVCPDGTVNVTDLLTLLAAWGVCP